MRQGVKRLIQVALLVFTAMLIGAYVEHRRAPVKSQGTAPPQGSIDIDKLDVGPYPTEPRPPLGVTGNPRMGVAVEAQRMANNVVGPWEVDSELTAAFGFGAMVLPNAETLTLIGPGGKCSPWRADTA